MVHGMAQDGNVFKIKTRRIRQLLEPLGYKFYYPSSPVYTESVDNINSLEVVSDTTFNGVRSWMLYDYEKKKHYIPEECIKFLREYILVHGYFDGIIAFSQGACVISYFITDFNELLGLDYYEQPQLKFFINFSGFIFDSPGYRCQYVKSPIRVPSLHFYGELDTLVDTSKTLELYNFCSRDSRSLVKHIGGHFVPTHNKILKKILSWLESLELSKHLKNS